MCGVTPVKRGDTRTTLLEEAPAPFRKSTRNFQALLSGESRGTGFFLSPLTTELQGRSSESSGLDKYIVRLPSCAKRFARCRSV